MSFDYDVFCSYRHKALDSVMTQNTFNAIESYRLPRSLRKKGYEDVKRAFRDTEELPVSRILTDTIDKALHSSRCMILVCSTDTPSSEWVDREVALFIELGRPEHIYPLLISGDPETSFPPSLKRIPDIMDRVMDVRVPGNNIKQMRAKEETELLRVIADVTGCPLPELQREHSLRKMRRFAAKCFTGVAFCFMVGAGALSLMKQARDYRDRAQASEQKSMRILQELTYELPDKLTGVPGAYGKISGILQENAEQINQILQLSTDQAGAELEIAANYEKYATAMVTLGEYTSATESQQKALELYTQLADASNDPAPLASAYNNLGRIYSRAGQYEQAEAAFCSAIRLEEELNDPSTLAAMLGNAGANAVEASYDTAEDYFTRCLEVLSGQPESYDNLLVRGNASLSYGAMLYRQTRLEDAEKQLTLAVQDYSALCALVDSRQNRNSLLSAVSSLALLQSDFGRYEEAESMYLQAIALASDLLDEDNTDSLAVLADLYNNYGINYSMPGLFEEAKDAYAQAAHYYKLIADATGAAPDVAAYAAACMNVSDACFKLHRYGDCRSAMEKGLNAYGSVADRLSEYRLTEYYAWSAYYYLICERDPESALNTALAAYQMEPTSVLTNMILGYCCLYTGYDQDCDRLLMLVASTGEGQADMLRLDLAAQQASGLYSEHLPEVLALLE